MPHPLSLLHSTTLLCMGHRSCLIRSHPILWNWMHTHRSYLNETRKHNPGATYADGSDIGKAEAAVSGVGLVLLCLGTGQQVSPSVHSSLHVIVL